MYYVTSKVAFFWDMTQKMETAYSSKMLLPISRTTHHIPQESNLLNVIILALGSTMNKAGY